MLTMAPGRPAATIARATAWAQRNPPLRFTPSTWSHSRSVSSRNAARGKTPALLTRMSGGPSPPVTAATRACTSRACATSPLTVRTLRPRPRISPATRSAAPGSSRKFRPTSAPSPAIASAMARPIPCCAPVTSATLPASRIGSLRYSIRRPLIIGGSSAMNRKPGSVQTRTFRAGEVIFREGDIPRDEAFLGAGALHGRLTPLGHRGRRRAGHPRDHPREAAPSPGAHEPHPGGGHHSRSLGQAARHQPAARRRGRAPGGPARARHFLSRTSSRGADHG